MVFASSVVTQSHQSITPDYTIVIETYILWAYNKEPIYAYGAIDDAYSYCEYLNLHLNTDLLSNFYGVKRAILTPKQLETVINLSDELAAI